MKVLMLGWEFPPHVTGGLATACAGLCQGLACIGDEITFVVPRAYGDEDQRTARVIGCDSVSLQRAVLESYGLAPGGEGPGPAASAAQPARESVILGQEPAVASAYATPADYLAWLARAPHAAGAGAEAAARGEDLGRVGQRRGDPVQLHFSGAYGHDLFSEVARYALCVSEIVGREPFDVVHAHDWMTYPAGIRAARTSGKPLVIHVHACEYDRSGDHPDERIRSLEQMGLDAAERVVCVSHYTARLLRRHYRVDARKLRVVHNAVDREQEPRRLPAGKRRAEPIVLFLGRVTFQKGPDYFLEAARRVVAIEPRVKFLMVGSGDMLPRMIEQAAAMGLARHVHFTGFLRRPDVQRVFSMADVYVMPSVSEPFGISPLEALSLDVPVIVSHQSGVSEVLRNALKVDFWDVQELANKILALLKRRALRECLLVSGKEELGAMSWEARARGLHGVFLELLPNEPVGTPALADAG